MSETIWPNGTKIEVLGVSGAYSSGKTLFTLTIDPQRTLYFDFEKSGGTYEALGIKRVDVPGELNKQYPKGYSPKQAFEYWYKCVLAVNADEFSVIVTDPISDIEDGLVEWVKSRYKEFGFKSADSFQSTGGIFWSRVKSEWKRILADLAARCQTFAFTSHLKAVWRHGKPTSQTAPKGKATLMELSSLYLLLEREAPAKDQPKPLVPSATVLKSRLSSIRNTDAGIDIVPSLPPRIPEATPGKIREYILSPPDYGHLDKEELEQEKELSAAEKLELEAKVAEDSRAAAEAQLAAARTQEKIADSKAKALAKLRPAPDKVEEILEAQKPDTTEAPQQEAETVKDDLLPEEDVRVLLRTAHGKGIIDKVLKGVWKTLNGRGVDVKGFNTDTAVDFTRQLTAEEFENFSNHVG
jgi:hypothetical protein